MRFNDTFLTFIRFLYYPQKNLLSDKFFMKEILFDVICAKLMEFNTGLFQSNKQTAMNVYFIKNLKKW